jgi:hypothetical protein
MDCIKPDRIEGGVLYCIVQSKMVWAKGLDLDKQNFSSKEKEMRNLGRAFIIPVSIRLCCCLLSIYLSALWPAMHSTQGYSSHIASHGPPLLGAGPIPRKPGPAADGLLAHLQLVDHEVVDAIARHLAGADGAAHGDVQDDAVVPERAGAARHGGAHDGGTVDIPDHFSRSGGRVFGTGTGTGAWIPGRVWWLLVLVRLLVPRECKGVRDACGLSHVRERGIDDAMLIPVLGVIMAPVQTGVIDGIPVPALQDIDLAIGRPGEGGGGQEPEGGPDAGGGGCGQRGDEAAAIAGERLRRDQPCRRVRLRRARVDDAADHERRVGCEEGVGGCRCVVLYLVVAPPVSPCLLLEELPDGRAGREVGLPVYGWWWWCYCCYCYCCL